MMSVQGHLYTVVLVLDRRQKCDYNVDRPMLTHHVDQQGTVKTLLDEDRIPLQSSTGVIAVLLQRRII